MSGARTVRPPRQQRSQEAWKRILDAGVALLEEQGREALTVTATCRRAGVAPTALYARVDGIAGLFWAVYDREMAHVHATLDGLLRRAGATPEGSGARIKAVIDAQCETFRRHGTFLHQIVNIAVTDPALRERGSRESLDSVERMAGLLPAAPRGAARDVARMLHQECAFRAMYGDHFLSRRPEPDAAFRRRVLAMALGRFGRSPAGPIK